MKAGTRKLLGLLAGGVAFGVLGSAGTAGAAASGPIKIGVIGEASAIAGASITKAAQLAADDINKAGGIDGRKVEVVIYDDHSSATDAVRAFQRAVKQDHVVAVVASYISEVALAIEPWAARLHTPFITPGAASTLISKNVHDNYDKNKYTFHGYINSAFQADGVCAFSHDVLAGKLHMKTAAIMSEDAAWTTPLDAEFAKCLPKAGLKVVDHIRFNPDTTDFTPIFNKIESKHPDVIETGMAHVGVQPTVQWHDQQVPVPMAGISAQASTNTFWKDTNGGADGVITYTAATPDVALTPKTVPFAKAYEKRFGASPSYSGYASYDAVEVIADAIKRAKSTDPDKMVAAMEKTDLVGTQGRIQFYGKDSQYAHALKYGKGLVTGLFIQWQKGKQVPIWPDSVAKAKVEFPSFIKLPQEASSQ
jgi:branched-chain amino acid transport system substrate-binding protein